MDEQRPRRRRELTPKERQAMERQRRKQRELDRKKARKDARYREEARKQARKRGQDSHIVVEIPARPEKPPQKPHKPKQKPTKAPKRKPAQAPKPKAKQKPYPKPKKQRKKSIPDIIERETDKRVRDMNPTEHKGGFYVDEVAVRKEQARKQRKKREKAQPKPLSPQQRRFRRIMTYVSIIAVVLIIGIVLSLTVLFKTEKIVVRGNDFYEDDKIIRLAGVTEGENIFMASMFGNARNVTDSLPYVRKTKIGFEIPDTLVIYIDNEVASSSIKSDGAYYLVSEDGTILEKVDKKPDNLMFVNAPKLKSTEIGERVEFEEKSYTDAMQDINESITTHNYEDITGINIQKLTNITITYDNRIVIKIGVPEKIDYKLRTAFTIIKEKLDPNNARTIRGVLNVSGVTESKKSYFTEVTAEDDEDTTEAPTTEPGATETETVRTNFIATEATTADPSEYFNEVPEGQENEAQENEAQEDNEEAVQDDGQEENQE